MEQTDLNLKNLPYWNSLSEDEKTFVRAHSAVHAYQKGALIHSVGSARVIPACYRPPASLNRSLLIHS